jgi:glycine betaine/choline ABC-type transport system substrate-binding protein
VHKALLAGELDLYVEYTGTALTAVLNEPPQGDSSVVYDRVKRKHFCHGHPRRRREKTSSTENI